MAEDDPQKTQTYPPPPDLVNIPVQLLDQWIAIPATERVESPLTRQDLDQLLFGLLRSTDAQSALAECMVQWSNNNLEGANKALADFRRLNVESSNYIRHFFMALMIGAVAIRNAKPK